MWKDIFTFHGRWNRLNRLRYFLYYILATVLFMVTILVLFALVNTIIPSTGSPSAFRTVVNFILYFLGLIVYFYFLFPLGFKRLHDLGHNGGWILLLFVPLANLILAIYLQFWEGEKGKNKYGPDPLEQK